MTWSRWWSGDVSRRYGDSIPFKVYKLKHSD
jgi:hypothetical protein